MVDDNQHDVIKRADKEFRSQYGMNKEKDDI